MFARTIRKALSAMGIGILAISVASAQDTTSGGWRRVGDPSAQTATAQAPTAPAPAATSDSNPAPVYPEPPSDSAQQQNYPAPQANYPAQPPYANQQPMPQQQPNYPAQNYPQGPYQPQGSYSPQGQYPMQGPAAQQSVHYPPVPSQITVPAGSYVTVRINQPLSSDRNQPGDAFSATLVKPLVANGVVVAEPGETVGGRVTQAQKAGRVEGLAKLGVELTDLTLVDGQQAPLRTTFVSRTGPSTFGRDAAGIATTTGLGAAIGAAADWGRGAAIGAGAGAAVGIIGVLVTRGAPSVILPEQVLTFRTEQPLTVSTEHSPQAFRYVQPGEYDQPSYGPGYGPAPMGPGAAYAAGPAPLYAPYPYYGYGYPYYGYPGFSVFIGPGFGRGYYYGPRGYGGFVYRGYRR